MLADPAHQSGATIQIPDLLTVPEAALLVRRHPETLRRAIRQGRLTAWRQPGCTLVSPETLKAYLDGYLCPASATKSLISNAVEASTTSSGGQAVNVEDFRRERMMRKMLDRAMGHLRVDQIEQRIWDQYAATRVRKPRKGDDQAIPVAAGTLRREFNVLRATMRRVWKDGYLVRPPEIEPPRDSAPRDRYLTKAEARRLLEACETPHVRAFVAIAIYTGARKGSILALTWDRVDWDTGMIDFQEANRPITGKRRSIVPMTRALRAEMEKAREYADGDFVIHWHGKQVPTGLRWSFSKACERAQLTWKPTPHHLKHSVASWFAMDRVPIDQAADWLATDPATLRRVYRKFDPAYLREIADSFEL